MFLISFSSLTHYNSPRKHKHVTTYFTDYLEWPISVSASWRALEREWQSSCQKPCPAIIHWRVQWVCPASQKIRNNLLWPQNQCRMGVMAGDRQSRFIISGKPIFHFFGPSTFSEFAMIHGGCLAKSNHEVPLDKVCVVSVVSQLVRDILMPLFPNETPCSECHATPNKGSTMAILCLGTVGLAVSDTWFFYVPQYTIAGWW